MKVYCVENKLDNKKYIGITKGKIERRFRQHKQKSKSLCKNHLHKAMCLYGVENFIIYEIDNALTKEELFEKESYWIKTLDTKVNGYNETDGGEGCWGWKASEEQKKKNSDQRKKYYENSENRKRLSDVIKKKWECLDEGDRKKRIDQFNKTKIGNKHAKDKTWTVSEQGRKNVSDAKKGQKYNMSNEGRKKLSEGATNRRLGKKHSAETIEKMRTSALQRKAKQMGDQH